MTSKSRGHCDNIKVFNQEKSNQIREKSGNLIAKNVWPPCEGSSWAIVITHRPSSSSSVCPSVHNLQTTSPPKPLIGIWPNFTGLILGWFSFKVVQMVPVHCMSRSQELKIDFLTKNLKNLLVRNHWTDFHIILQKCSFGDPLPRLFKPFGFVKKHGRQGAGLTSLYIYIENFKNLLVRNHWTDLHWFPLPRLFKPFGFVKKHGHQGAGLIFPIYLY